MGRIGRHPSVLALAAVLGAFSFSPASAPANTSHAGWPPITGMLLMNKLDQARPLDGRPGGDPFDGTDYSNSCPKGQLHSHCIPYGVRIARHDGVTCATLTDAEAQLARKLGITPRASRCTQTLPSAALVPATIGHNELLGGHGNDDIHAGPAGDVIWGDYKSSGQPTTQVDTLVGGAGNDFIYASHGTNHISTGGGTDVVHAHFGRGTIRCGSRRDIAYLSRKVRPLYHVTGCRISYKTLGY
jgi:Ca2+-binding RTX toxin-like protein